MSSDELGVHLLFIGEEYGGMGGDTVDVYRVCEQMARIDLGLATSVFATSLGSDPVGQRLAASTMSAAGCPIIS